MNKNQLKRLIKAVINESKVLVKENTTSVDSSVQSYNAGKITFGQLFHTILKDLNIKDFTDESRKIFDFIRSKIANKESMNGVDQLTAKKTGNLSLSSQDLSGAAIAEDVGVAQEHRGAKGMMVGKTRSKNFPQGKSGLAKPKSVTAAGGSEEEVVKKYLQKASNVDHLLDVTDVLGIKVPLNMSRFDPSDVSHVILNHLYQDGKDIDPEELKKVYNFIIAAGYAKA